MTPAITATASYDATAVSAPSATVIDVGSGNNHEFNFSFAGLIGPQGPQGPQGEPGSGVPMAEMFSKSFYLTLSDSSFSTDVEKLENNVVWNAGASGNKLKTYGKAFINFLSSTVISVENSDLTIRKVTIPVTGGTGIISQISQTSFIFSIPTQVVEIFKDFPSGASGASYFLKFNAPGKTTLSADYGGTLLLHGFYFDGNERKILAVLENVPYRDVLQSTFIESFIRFNRLNGLGARLTNKIILVLHADPNYTL